MYKPIRKADLVLGGTSIKQGEIFTLGFQLFDANGLVIVPTVGQTISVKVANKTGVVFETTAVVVSDHIEFTVAENIGAGKMRVELTVSDGANVLQKYPANGYIELYITASLDDIGTGTIYTVTAAEMFARIEGSETASTSAVQTAGEAVVIAGNAVVTADAVRADFDLVVAEAGSSNPEVVLARGGETDLKTRLDKTSQQLADTTAQIATLASGSPKGTFATLSALQADAGANTVEGRKSTYVVTADGNWYYYNAGWQIGGLYQNNDAIQALSTSVDALADLKMRNLKANGDFSSGTANWSANASTISATGGILTATATANSGGLTTPTFALSAGHKYYIVTKIKSAVPFSLKLALDRATAPYTNYGSQTFNTTVDFVVRSFVASVTEDTASGVFRFRDTRVSGWTAFDVDYAMIIDLTESFGAGKEPSALKMDEFLSDSYFEGEFLPGYNSVISTFYSNEENSPLLNSEIQNTIRSVVFTNDRKVSSVLHKRGVEIIRSDVFTYSTDLITEVRTMNTGETLTLIYNTKTFETEVI